jgi:hypothetical protein
VDAANENVKAQVDASVNQHAEVVLGDFFEQGYETNFGPDFEGFDLVYDYTVSESALDRLATSADNAVSVRSAP